jgi:hypothetical protein
MGASGEFGLGARVRSPLLLAFVGAAVTIATYAAICTAHLISWLVLLGTDIEISKGNPEQLTAQQRRPEAGSAVANPASDFRY